MNYIKIIDDNMQWRNASIIFATVILITFLHRNDGKPKAIILCEMSQ